MAKKEEKKEEPLAIEDKETFGAELEVLVKKYLNTGAHPFAIIGLLHAMTYDILEHLKNHAEKIEAKEDTDVDY